MRALTKTWCVISFSTFAMAATGCAVQASEGDDPSAASSSTEQALFPAPPPDPWLDMCTLKGGKENTQKGGIRMCCFTDANGTVCVSDPGAVVKKVAAGSAAGGTGTVTPPPRREPTLAN